MRGWNGGIMDENVGMLRERLTEQREIVRHGVILAAGWHHGNVGYEYSEVEEYTVE